MTVLLGGEVLPAGQRLQGERLRLLETLRSRRFASLLRQVFCHPVDPYSLQCRAGDPRRARGSGHSRGMCSHSDGSSWRDQGTVTRE
jgi:hypothetical protein